MSVGGHEQSIDLNTATRAPDAQSAPFYLQKPAVAVSATLPHFSDTYTDGTDITYDLAVDTVTFTPYDPTNGWAPTGQMWAETTVKHDWTAGGTTTIDTSGWGLTADSKPAKAVNTSDAEAERRRRVPSTSHDQDGRRYVPDHHHLPGRRL